MELLEEGLTVQRGIIIDELERTIARVGRGGKVRVKGSLAIDMMACLLNAYPRPAHKNHIYDWVYEQRDYQPDIKIIDVKTRHLRQEIAPLGLEIESIWGGVLKLIIKPIKKDMNHGQ